MSRDTRIQIWLPPAVRDQTDAVAEELSLSRCSLIRMALISYLSIHGTPTAQAHTDARGESPF